MAAVLHLQHGAGAAGQASGGKGLKGAPGHGGDHLHDGLPLRGGLFHMVEKPDPLAGAAHHIGAQRPDLVGGQLRIAAADPHHGVGILLPRPPDGVAGLLIARGCDGAGVDDIAVAGGIKVCQCVAPGQQHLLHGLRLVLVDFTSQRKESKFHRESLRQAF